MQVSLILLILGTQTGTPHHNDPEADADQYLFSQSSSDDENAELDQARLETLHHTHTETEENEWGKDCFHFNEFFIDLSSFMLSDISVDIDTNKSIKGVQKSAVNPQKLNLWGSKGNLESEPKGPCIKIKKSQIKFK